MDFRRPRISLLSLAVCALLAACASSRSPILHKSTPTEISSVLEAALTVVEPDGGHVTLVLASDLLPAVREAAGKLREVVQLPERHRGERVTLSERQFLLQKVVIGGDSAEVEGVLGPAWPKSSALPGCGSTYKIKLSHDGEGHWAAGDFTVTRC